MNYRPSSYNILIKNKLSDEFILVNGQTKALDLVSSEIGEILLKNDYIKDGLLEDEELETLIKRGYVTTLSSGEEKKCFVQYVEELHKLKSKNVSITIIPTYQCNLNCFYCFESSQNSSVVITKDLVDKAITIFEKSLEKYNCKADGMTFGLFGGEPLLVKNKDIIQYIYDKVSNKGMKTSLVTNGTQLEHFFDIFNPKDVSLIQITLDGIKEEHDKRRIYKSGKGTFDKIVRNINLAVEKGFYVSVRINIDMNNMHTIEALNKFAIEQGWNTKKNMNVYCSQIYNTGNPDKANLATPYQVYTYSKKIKDLSILTEKNGLETKILDILNGDNAGVFNSGYCNTDYNESYVFDPYGKVYDCIANIGKEEYIIGTYDDGYIKKISEKRIMSVCGSVVHKAHCIDNNCKYMLFCGGGCSERVSGDKDVFYEHYCEDFAKIFDLVLQMHVKSLSEKNCS